MPIGWPSAGTVPGTGVWVPDVGSVVVVDELGADVVEQDDLDDGIDDDVDDDVDDDPRPLTPASSCWNCWRSASWCEASEIPVPHKR